MSTFVTDKRNAYGLPGGRTELQVAAEVLALVLDSGLVRKSPRTVAELAAAVSVPIPMVAAAWEQLRAGRRVKLTSVPARAGDPLIPPHKPDPEPVKPVPKNLHKANAAKKRKKEPRAGVRICGRCGPQPKRAFGIKNKRTGQLKSWCKPCLKEYQGERYLTSERLERLGPVLRLILCEGDVHCGTPCAEASNRVRLGKKSSRRRPSSLTQRVRNDESPRRQGLGSVVGGLWLPPHHF